MSILVVHTAVSETAQLTFEIYINIYFEFQYQVANVLIDAIECVLNNLMYHDDDKDFSV